MALKQTVLPSLVDLSGIAGEWLRTAALPLWAERGMDREVCAFEERLDWAKIPNHGVPRRLMVQARQVAVYSAAGLSGRYPDGCGLALDACRAMIKTYHRADGRPGWLFSADTKGFPVDSRRDLYAHAFVLFALAWISRFYSDDMIECTVSETIAFLDDQMSDTLDAGYWDCIPPMDAVRRQNPHMHLFEAYLSLYETRPDPSIVQRCRMLRDLAVKRFMAEETGALREDFTARWDVYPGPGLGRVEPGHQFEWAWLLRHYEKITKEDQSKEVSKLLGMAVNFGLDRTSGRIIDEIDEEAKPRLVSSRSWPHAEALKSLTAEAALGETTYHSDIANILNRLLQIYCPASLEGGWIDHVGAVDEPLSTSMPASTLYHLYFGLTAVEDFIQGDSSCHLIGI